MRKTNCWDLTMVAAVLLFGCRATAFGQELATAVADWKFVDCEGREHVPFASQDIKAVVIVFISTDCPISNGYQPVLSRLVQAQSKFSYFFVHASPRTTREMGLEHARQFKIGVPVILDPDQELGRRLGAKTVPQAFVVGRDGTVLYNGRIDDQYAGFGKKRPAPTRQDLAEALADIAQGKDVSVPVTEAIGCEIQYDK